MANRFLSNIRINDAYTFPASDGTNNQVIKTDGSGNLSFGQLAADSASVMYKDTFTGDGSTTGFSLANALNDEVQSNIYIDGVYQSKSTYSVSGTTVTFSTAPASGHEIEVISTTGINSGPTAIYTDTFTANGSATAFTLGQTVHDENQTIVFLNGVYQFKGTYTLSGTTLTLDTAPANGVAIEVMSIGSAYSGGDILYDHDFTSAGLMTTNGSGVYSITANNSANWNTAYGWGDHSTQGYITDGNTNWNNSYGFITSSSTETLTNKSGNISMFTNDSNYATQSYVGTQISNLVDSSPAALDTLNELAAALGDDANFSTTVTNSIALKAPLASPSFTGVPSFSLNDGTFIKAVNATSNIASTNIWGYGLYEGGSKIAEISLVRDGSNNQMYVGTTTANQTLRIGTGNKVTALTIDASQNSTFAGNISGVRGFFNSGSTNVVATFTSTDGIATLQCADPTGNVEFGASGNNFVVQPAGGVAQLTVGSSTSTFAGEIRTTNRLAIKETYFGYSASYKVIQVGESAAEKSISLGYDPSGNTNGGFSGNEILIPNNIRILAPAANNSGYYGLMMLNSSNKVLLGASSYLIESDYIMALDTATKNVGIGTDSPTAKLDISGMGSGGVTVRIKGAQNMVSNYYYGFMHDGTDIRGLTQSNIFYAGGSVNANTTITDWASLRISTPILNSGSVVTNNYAIYQESSLQKSYFAGNVGINTTVPAHKLEVNGSIKIANTNNRLVFGTPGGTDRRALEGDTSGSLLQVGEGYADIALQGNVGIGATSPGAKLEVKEGHTILGGTQNNYGGNVFTTKLGGYGVLSTGTDRYGSYGWLTFNSNNNYTGSARGFAFTNGYKANEFALLMGTSDQAAPTLGAQGEVGNGQLVFHVNNSADFMFGKVAGDGNGPHLQVNSYSYSSTFQGSSTANMVTYKTGTELNTNVGALVFRDNGNDYCGQITVNGATNTTSYLSASDYRLKEDLKSFDGMSLLEQIQVYDFKWKKENVRTFGVLAHELKEVLPLVVDGDKDEEKYQTVDYSKIVPVLIKAIQELKADNDSLKARIETLENN